MQYLQARVSNSKNRASAIKVLKSDKRKFTVGHDLRIHRERRSSAFQEAQARSAWHSTAELCIRDKPGERKGGVSQTCFKIRSSELQICYGKKELSIVSHPSMSVA